MAPGYAVAIALELAGSVGLILALILIRKDRVSKAAGLRGYFGDGRRRPNVARQIISVSVQPVRTATGSGCDATARAALQRALLTA